MDGIITLAERHRRRFAAMENAVLRLDVALAAYASAHGGRFVRFGSSATGHLRVTSDIDLIADFADHGRIRQACSAAEELCRSLGLRPDVWPAGWVAERLIARALAEGVILS